MSKLENIRTQLAELPQWRDFGAGDEVEMTGYLEIGGSVVLTTDDVDIITFRFLADAPDDIAYLLARIATLEQLWREYLDAEERGLSQRTADIAEQAREYLKSAADDNQ